MSDRADHLSLLDKEGEVAKVPFPDLHTLALQPAFARKPTHTRHRFEHPYDEY